MTLEEISSLMSRATRFKVGPEELVLSCDSVQKLAFSENLIAFREYETNMTIYMEIEFLSAGYTSAVIGDIGKAVVGGTSATSGTLISYNNTTRKWVINLAAADDYTASEAITITTGTGAGTLLATEFQIGFKGPYDYPTSPPVRKMHGITTNTDARIYGTDIVYTDDQNDYGLYLEDYNERKFYKAGRINEIDQEYTFTTSPNRTDTFRWFYWFKPTTISDLTTGAAGDGALAIPDTYHGNYAQACIGWLDAYINKKPFTKDDVEHYMKDWWTELEEVYTPQGKKSNQTSRGSLLGNWFVP